MRAEAGPVLYASVSSRASTWSDPTTSLLNKEMRSGQEEGAYRVMGQGCCPKGEQGGQTGLPSPRASSELSDPLRSSAPAVQNTSKKLLQIILM